MNRPQGRTAQALNLDPFKCLNFSPTLTVCNLGCLSFTIYIYSHWVAVKTEFTCDCLEWPWHIVSAQY